MGTYNHTYVGVFIKAPAYKDKIERKVYKNKTGKIVNTRFNPETGEENNIDVIIDIVTVRPVPYITDNDEFAEDEFFTPVYSDINVFLSTNTKYRFTDDDLFVFNMDRNFDFNKLITDFEIEYSEYLKYYKNKYPKCDFEICFGVVNYAH